MPKDDPDDEAPKKRVAALHDDEDDEFDREIGESMDDEDDAPAKLGKKHEDALDDDPLDREDDEELDPELLKAGSKEVFSDDEGDDSPPATPKPTFKYNVPPPPSDNPIADPKSTLGEHTLDDLSEEDNAPQPTRRPFQVDRGFQPTASRPHPQPVMPEEDDFEHDFSSPPTPSRMHQEEFSDEHDNLTIPSIRKQNPIYPPHQNRVEDDDYQIRSPYPQQNQRQQGYNPYGNSDQSQRFGYRERGPKGASKWHIIVLLLIGGGVIAATVYLLQNQFNFPGQPTANASPTPATQITESTPMPTATPAPLERSQFKVRVLNGTTESGIAKKVLDKMKELGYQTDRAGNAPKQDYAQTVIRVKEGDATLSAQLTKDLAPDYEASISPDLEKDANVNAEIILGEK